jgi:AcrR family transcriptional regulator
MSQEPIRSEGRKPGRPRSEQARKAILDAAYAIVMEEGLGRLTVEAVAARAAVGKPTIYRYWANAQELAMAAFLSQPVEAVEVAPTPAARDDLRWQLRNVIAAFATPRGRQIAITIASVDSGSEIAKAFRNQIILRSREAGRAILTRAMAGGEVRADTPTETVLDMIYGPIFYRLLAGHQPLTSGFADEVIDTAFVGIAGKSAGRKS